MNKIVFKFLFYGLLLFPLNIWAASCCGGGTASSLILPKLATAMVDYSVSHVNFNGRWDTEGKHIDSPSNRDSKEYKVNLGFAYRLADRWQASIQVPYQWNDYDSPGKQYNTSDMGDSVIGFWYENFDDVKCVWKITNWRSLIPAVYFGSSLTIPTGNSRYTSEDKDVTGQGFYRLDTHLFMEKTVYPWSLSLQASYGKYLERPINQESGKAIEPYDKQLGDRISTSLSFGYTHFLESLSTLSFSTSISDLRERDGEIDGMKDPSVLGFKKQSVGLSASYSTPALDWIYKLSFNHALHGNGRGENAETSDTINLGVSYVIR